MRKVGYFKISDSILFDPNLEQALLAVFSKFIPTSIELGHGQFRKYYGFSPEFEEIKEGEPYPEYICVLIEDNKLFTVRFDKISW